MKITVNGRLWLVETKLMPTLPGNSHQIIAAARQSGVDALMGDGLVEAIDGSKRLLESGYSRARAAQGTVSKLFGDSTGSLRAIISALVLAMVGFNSLFLSINGLFMLVTPDAWYELVPGVTQTGLFNQHFIRDIGIIQLLLGVAFGIGMFRPERRIGLWAAATLWLGAHAALHLWEVAVGICAPSAILRDFPAVSLPAIFGAFLTLWAIKHANGQRMRALETWRSSAFPALLRSPQS